MPQKSLIVLVIRHQLTKHGSNLKVELRLYVCDLGNSSSKETDFLKVKSECPEFRFFFFFLVTYSI